MKKKIIFFLLIVIGFSFLSFKKINAYQTTFDDFKNLINSFDYIQVRNKTNDITLTFEDDHIFAFDYNSMNYDYTVSENTTSSPDNFRMFKYYSFLNRELKLVTHLYQFKDQTNNITYMIDNYNFYKFDFIYSLDSLLAFRCGNFKFNVNIDASYITYDEYGRMVYNPIEESYERINQFNFTEFLINNYTNSDYIYFSYLNIEIDFVGINNAYIKDIYIDRNIVDIEDYDYKISEYITLEVPRELKTLDYDFTKWIIQIFNTFDAFFAIRFGSITIGQLILIPAILTIVFVILRIWRGGSA